jgi:hypothetical protein
VQLSLERNRLATPGLTYAGKILWSDFRIAKPHPKKGGRIMNNAEDLN